MKWKFLIQKFRFGGFQSHLSQFDCVPLMFGEFWADLMWFVTFWRFWVISRELCWILRRFAGFWTVTIDFGSFLRVLASFLHIWVYFCWFCGFSLVWVFLSSCFPKRPGSRVVVMHTLPLLAVLFRFFRCCLSSSADWLVLRFQVNTSISSVTIVFCLFSLNISLSRQICCQVKVVLTSHYMYRVYDNVYVYGHRCRCIIKMDRHRVYQKM